MKTGTTATIFHPKNRVNIISQKLVVSIFGIPLRANFETSMIATIMPICAISITLNLLCKFVNPRIFISISYRLSISAVLAVLTVYI